MARNRKRPAKKAPAHVGPKSAAPVAATHDGLTDLGAPYRRLSDRELVVFADGPKPYTVSVNGQIYSHCGDDANGRWIYRVDR